MGASASRNFKPPISVAQRVSSWALTPRLARGERELEEEDQCQYDSVCRALYRFMKNT
jgi:hypothetical protein